MGGLEEKANGVRPHRLMAAGKVLGESGAGMHNQPEAGEDEEMADA
jgi:hypothetical protein